MDPDWKYYDAIVNVIGDRRYLTSVTKDDFNRSCTVVKYSEDLRVEWWETITWESLDREPEVVLEWLRLRLVFN
jgi:hypothetical protein